MFEALLPTENRVRVRLNRVNTGGLVPNTALSTKQQVDRRVGDLVVIVVVVIARV